MNEKTLLQFNAIIRRGNLVEGFGLGNQPLDEINKFQVQLPTSMLNGVDSCSIEISIEPPPKKARKVIQIASHGVCTCILCDDGTIWTRYNDGNWLSIPGPILD